MVRVRSESELHLQEDPRLQRPLPFAGGQGGQSGVPRDSYTRGAFCAFKALLSVLSSTPPGLGRAGVLSR